MTKTTVKFKEERTKKSCIFNIADKYRFTKSSPFCKITIYETCHPESCPFYKNRRMLDESYEKARRNYIKTYGEDKYYQNGFAKIKLEDNEDEGLY
jgi:hypothetical protein